MRNLSVLKLDFFVATTLIAATSFLPSQAQNFAQRHPRRAQVVNRNANLNRRINYNRGDLGGHYGQLSRENQGIRRQQQTDAYNNGGFITPWQQGKLNREQNAVSAETRLDNTNNPFVQNHPRRSEVLSRDANLNGALNNNEGHLNGQYNQLMQQDHSIAQQAQQDARANGGYITPCSKGSIEPARKFVA